MNWSGGYKYRFRPRLEVIRKAAFQQQNRIVLVDDVTNGDEVTEATPDKKETVNSLTPPLLCQENEEKAIFDLCQHQQAHSPFSNIPCGSSSDSEESLEHVMLSDTNYSPFSDQDTRIENSPAYKKKGLSQFMTKETDTSLVQKQNHESYKNSQEMFGSPLTSRFDCDSPPIYPNQDNEYQSSSLNFSTPIAHSQRGPSSIDATTANDFIDDYSNISPETCSTPACRVITVRTIEPNLNYSDKPTQKDNHKTAEFNRILYSHSTNEKSNNLVLGQRKQVRFATNRDVRHDENESLVETINGRMPPLLDEGCANERKRNWKKIISLKPIVATEKTANPFEHSIPKDNRDGHIDQDLSFQHPTIDHSTMKSQVQVQVGGYCSTKKKRKAASRKSGFYFNRKLKFRKDKLCHCRMIVKKIKIRDAETQTSP